MSAQQPNIQSRSEYSSIVSDSATEVRIPGTRKTVRVRWLKPYTIERLTELWLERDRAVPDNSAETLRSMCMEPYFAVREAVLIVLNDWWRIRLLYRVMTWLWGKWYGYTEEQMRPIIETGKKKVPLMAHWTNMVYSMDMRADWMRMTQKEAEQFRAELLSAARQPS